MKIAKSAIDLDIEEMEEKAANRAKILISYEALIELLHMPKDTKIIDVESGTDDRLAERFVIYVEHPDLPRVYPTMALRTLAPEIKFDWGLNGE